MKNIMHLLLLSLLPLLLVVTKIVVAGECIEKERNALLDLKANLKDSRGLMSSWKGLNCCSWYRVTCDNKTGHIIKLNLRNYNFSKEYALTGDISPSLVHLTRLMYLDLRSNDFSGARIPDFIGSLKNLRYLDLSGAGFAGKIPPHLGNLSNLNYLDISFPSDCLNSSSISVDNLVWLSRLSSLAYLDMSYWNLSAASDWMKLLNMLSSLQELHLESTHLPPTDLNSLTQSNLTVLNKIDLSGNNFSSAFPYWLTNINTLSEINLGYCGLHGPIPEAVGNLTALEHLFLYGNSLAGAIPVSIGKLCNLSMLDFSNNNLTGGLGKVMTRCMKRLFSINLGSNNLSGSLSGWLESMTNLVSVDLSKNSLSGLLPSNISQLTKLKELDLSYNLLQGILSEQHLANLSMLSKLDLSYNLLRISVGANWLPPFQLYELKLHSCPLEALLPQWLQTQTKMVTLDLHNTRTMGLLPDWLWTSMTSLESLDLAKNLLTGILPASLVHMKSLQYLRLDSNQLEGQIPDLPESLYEMDLSNNSLSGLFPHNFGGNNMEMVFLSSNHLNGSIPIYLCDITFLAAIDLSNNSLSGVLPDCWKQGRLFLMDFSNNNLEGEIPSSLGSLTLLGSLHLSKNMLSGPLPSSLSSCKYMFLLDLGENNIEGPIPTWIGQNLQFLVILRLRSNQFSGNIPSELSQLELLEILDLANNKLSGPLPRSIGNFSAMASNKEAMVFSYGSNSLYYNENLYITTKGEERLYSSTLYLMKSIDLSKNDLTGEIPADFGALAKLNNLNLSRNLFSGHIPERIGNMVSLESFDLSWNQLSGIIPESMTALYSLSQLNMSYNNLSGKIPLGSQLQTLGAADPYIYADNKYLCSPLNIARCSEQDGDPLENAQHKDDRDILLYIFSGLGFGSGFSAVWWFLVFSKAVSKGYFLFVDSICERVCDWMILMKMKVHRKLVGRNEN